MYSERQQQILREIIHGLELTEPEHSAVLVEQSPSYVDSVVETADFAVAALGTIGSTVAAIGERRGLGPQQVRIDRRHSQLLFNARSKSTMWLLQSMGQLSAWNEPDVS